MRVRAGIAIFAALLASSAPASGQQTAKGYPGKPIRMVVPFVPGGTMDFIGQVLGQKQIAPSIGTSMFIDNRAGAGGIVGTDAVAKAPPDGHTMLVTSSSHVILPAMSKTLPYDPVKDFAPITLVARSVGSVLVVHPSVPAYGVKEFVALAKAHPGQLNYGSGGIGHIMHFATESLNLAAGIRMTHVPYKGIGQAINDLLTGRIEVGVVSTTIVAPHVKAGKLRPLGITALTRWSELPDVPTIDEAGVKGYSYATWYGIWFPAGTPPEIVARMNAEVVKAYKDGATARTFAERGLIAVATTPQEFAQMIVKDIDLHRQLVARMGPMPQ